MEHELAKKLKEAGFPFIQKKVLMKEYEQVWKMETDPQLVPGLEELINACGGMFRSVGRDRIEDGSSWNDDSEITEWEAIGWKEDPSMFSKEFGEYIGRGKTSREAVARLWLKLNEK